MTAVRTATVLVVEDDRQIREMFRHALAVCGYRVTTTGDGVGALRYLEGDHADVIVLDLMLPHVGGLDVYKELRAHPETRDIPVVIVTGSDARELGPNQFRFFLRKPVSPETLTHVVEDALLWPQALGT
jgi:CheY-like chemotaxis protein